MQTFDEQIGDWIRHNRERLNISHEELPVICPATSQKQKVVEGLEAGMYEVFEEELLPLVRMFISRAKGLLA